MTKNEEQFNTVDGDLDENVEDSELLENDGELTSAQDVVAAPAKKKHSKAEVAVNVALWIAIVVLLIMVILRLFVYNSIQVKGDSMNSTYEDGNVVVVNKAIAPSRGDVVVFYLNDVDNKLKAMFAPAEQSGIGQPYEKLIKRVVAVAGDKIWVNCIRNAGSDAVYEVIIDTADGTRVYEDYYVKKGETLPKENYDVHAFIGSGLGVLNDCTEQKPYVVSKDCIFVMGDNRGNSNDSRNFGEVPISRLFGVVLDK